MDIDELIERLEQATGPSRELDATIWWLYGEGKSRWPECAHVTDPALACGLIFGRNPQRASDVGWDGVGYRGPAFTASIDAALTLVPEDTFWRVGHDGEGPDPSLIKAQVGVAQEGGTWVTFRSAVAATPPVALCVAALKARKAAQ